MKYIKKYINEAISTHHGKTAPQFIIKNNKDPREVKGTVLDKYSYVYVIEYEGSRKKEYILFNDKKIYPNPENFKTVDAWIEQIKKNLEERGYGYSANSLPQFADRNPSNRKRQTNSRISYDIKVRMMDMEDFYSFIYKPKDNIRYNDFLYVKSKRFKDPQFVKKYFLETVSKDDIISDDLKIIVQPIFDKLISADSNFYFQVKNHLGPYLSKKYEYLDKK